MNELERLEAMLRARPASLTIEQRRAVSDAPGDLFPLARPGAAGRITMRFREELHAIEAVVAGQGVAICSDLLVRKELTEGLLVCLSPVPLEGYGLYLVMLPGQATAGTVKNFCAWNAADVPADCRVRP